ncbi:DNA-binding response OmpR family regulator [Algoriphagus ratkowskyi]|uniref:DNA-binding response OmpR family regulator n=1 Tax=Algoriphagus ratkowskyi TaxID=57028 RepID=A0A2W7RAT2_9BACT|nr:response regulator transcription factor [Algoriphagus ratkowskyi]PZX57614.1 DNA-binding response OmpR family regulator [Algoriphagus ratkowskyi]TXD78888.1 response regulator transcription factor [Algoriphagus ratkowskyi]
MKILVIEDEKVLASDIVNYLSEEDYRCETASDFATAKEKVSMYEYDCILLDLMLPGGDGFDILEHLRSQNKQDGVIIISAKNTLEDKIKGLNIGADDYLAKPFHHSELAARIHSVIRRKQFDPSNLITQNEIKIDLLSKTVHIDGNPIVLTKKEYDLLLFFIGNKNRVLSKSALAEHLSGDVADMFDSHDFVYAHVKNLKKKLNEADYGNYLKTMYGTGYKWEI